MTIYHDGSWMRHELEQLARGYVVERSGKRYRACSGCGGVIRMDKPLLGSIHICADRPTQPFPHSGEIMRKA